MSLPIPQVSVVMGVRDGGRELRESARSVLAQTGVELELIVVDDGSTDSTGDVLTELAAADRRLRVIRQEARGLTPSLIRGCGEARAPFIARHDAGDLSHPERLARQVELLELHPDVVLVSCWTACVGPAGEPLAVERGGGAPGAGLALLPEESGADAVGPSSHGSTLFRRAAYLEAGGYRNEFALAQDWDLWYRLGSLGRFAMAGSALYLRRLLPSSLSFGAHDLQVELRALACEAARRRARGEEEWEQLALAAGLSSRFERERPTRRRRGEALGDYHLGALLLRLGDRRATEYLSAAVRRRPWMARAWLRLAQARLRPATRHAPEGFAAPETRALVAALAGGSRSPA